MTTEVQTSTADQTKREVEITVPVEVVAEETEKLVKKYQKLAKLPGFRQGKVPANVVRQRFAEELRSEMVETLIPRYFQQEVLRLGVSPISQPKVTELHLHEGEPLRFKASFDVLPEIKLGDYKSITAEKKDISVSDEEVQKALENLQSQQATFTGVEGRNLKDGDFAQIGFKAQPKDEPEAEPTEVEEVMVEIGGSNTVADFSDNLRGAAIGEVKTFDVAYGADFQDERLAGKTITYTVTVKGIKERSVPELNDSFAKELGAGLETLDDLKKRIREQMEGEKKHAAEHEAKDKLIEELVKRNDFPVPESLIEHQVDTRLERGLRALAAQGMRQEDMRKLDWNRLRAGQREGAEREVKASLILEKIAEAEKIEVSEDELAREVQTLSQRLNEAPEALRERLTREGTLDRIRERIRNEKTLEFLYTRSA